MYANLSDSCISRCSSIWLAGGGVSFNSSSSSSSVAAAADDDDHAAADDLVPLKFLLSLDAVVDDIISSVFVGSDNSFIKVSKISFPFFLY